MHLVVLTICIEGQGVCNSWGCLSLWCLITCVWLLGGVACQNQGNSTAQEALVSSVLKKGLISKK